ncbi:hypothetical protein [Aquisalimonas asiatica]|uniref:Uncharacterized protein n=1 Tax=Aquisalimonas asiatica TaxID=406100 RepID=A0A1H8V2R1_9GAMM|nr:hypothetical protein [Aquisalimonas asiatica]SEP09705.1 hypothetical protein SAMN04488052_10993 [Aquisalimonas asiatica]
MSVSHPQPAARRRVAGWLLAGTALFTVVTAMTPADWRIAAGITAWAACLLMLPDIARRSRWQSGVLMTLGAGGMLWGLFQGEAIQWQRAVAANTGLISLLIGVSFLQLVAMPRRASDTTLPTGPSAYRNTQVGVQLFGSVINLSTVFIVGDRLTREQGMDRRLTILLTRSFSVAAFWSPFFASMAAALAFAPDANVGHLIATGLPLATAALLGTYLLEGRKVDHRFQGYPIRYDSLALPGLLAVTVLVVHAFYPEVSVIALITLLGPMITMAALIPRGRSGRRALKQQVEENLPGMGNELSLFLAAGVLAAGLGSVLATTGDWLPFQAFGGLEAWLTLVAMIGLAMVGVHPVISVATFGTMLEPLNPDHSLLAATFLAGWALGVCVSPLSGLTLAFQGRYGVDGTRITRWNLGYTAWMLGLCAVSLSLLAMWTAGG